MSGPKVINIEMLQKQLERRAQQELQHLRLVLRSLGRVGLNEHELKDFNQRISDLTARIQQLERSKNWVQITHEASAISSFIKSEIDEIARRKQERHELRLRARSNLVRTSHLIRKQCDALGIPCPPNLMDIKLGMSDEQQQQVSADIARTLEDLIARKVADQQSGESQRIKEILSEFVKQNEITSVSSLRQKDKDPRQTKMFQALAQIHTWLPPDRAAFFSERFQRILNEPDSSERLVRLDSLNLELSEERKRLQDVEQARELLENAMVILSPFSDAEVQQIVREIEKELVSPQLKKAEMLIDQSKSLVDKITKEADSRHCRGLVLKALAELGYEIREGMELTWEKDGRVVISKPQDSDYGVEFMMAQGAPSIQARVVAFRDAGSETQTIRQRDKEVEEAWCSDFARMRSSLSDQGFNSKITHAVNPGGLPVKSIGSKQASAGAARTEVRKLKERKL